MRLKVIFASAVFALSAFAQSKPDFSGTWTLNMNKSDFGPVPPPESRTDVVTQTDIQIKDAVSEKGGQGPGDVTFSYNTDGTESVNKLMGKDMKSVAKWDGAALVIASKFTFQDQDASADSKFTLSPDGKTLTVAVHYTTGMGDADVTMVFDKQIGAVAAQAAPAPPTPAPATPAPTTTTAATGPHPNFSGNWKLNVAKSDFGPMPGPDSQIEKIDHKDPVLKNSFQAKTAQGDMSGDLMYTTDGKPSANTFAGNELKGNAVWDGVVLVFDNTLTMQGTDIAIKTRWELSPDGKTLTQSGHINSPMGEMDQKLVFEKQPD